MQSLNQVMLTLVVAGMFLYPKPFSNVCKSQYMFQGFVIGTNYFNYAITANNFFARHSIFEFANGLPSFFTKTRKKLGIAVFNLTVEFNISCFLQLISLKRRK